MTRHMQTKYTNPHTSLLMLALIACACVFSFALVLGVSDAFAAESGSIAGANRYDTAAQQARAAYPSGSSCVIVASGENGYWADALSASGLAGALDCPILFAQKDYLPSETWDTITTLGAKHVILIGGTASVSEAVENTLGACGSVTKVDRIAGDDRYATQVEIYRYGKSGYDGKNHWGSELAIVASGANFPDALSGSYLAVRKAAPIFLVDGSGEFNADQEEILLYTCFNQSVLIGGTDVISDETYGFVEAASMATSKDAAAHVVRIGGDTRYETSSLVAQWCVDQGYASWDKLSFVSGDVPYDALAGSVLTAKRGSVMLLASYIHSSTFQKAISRAYAINTYSYFGGTSVFPESLRTYIAYSIRAGYFLPMGASRLPDRSFVYCDSTGVYREDNIYYSDWIALANEYSSVTGWLILVDTWSNHVVIFSGMKGAWVVEQYWQCTSGAPSSPTVKGQFVIGSRGLSFGHGYTCWYWTQFYGNYLFHSVKYNPGSMTSIQDGRLGVNASAGCVRLEISNAKWIYDYIPSGTKVVVG